MEKCISAQVILRGIHQKCFHGEEGFESGGERGKKGGKGTISLLFNIAFLVRVRIY